MSKKIVLEFTSDIHQFLQYIEDKTQNLPNLYQLSITDIPSINKCVELISNEDFKTKIAFCQSLLCVIFKINEEICEKSIEDQNLLNFSGKSFFFIAFESMIGDHCCKIYWKDSSRSTFYSLFLDDNSTGDVSMFLYEFLEKQLRFEQSGM